VRETLGLDDELRVDAVISLGYARQTRPSVPAEELHWEQIIELPGGLT
jgi:hypothetical protein